MSLEDTIRELLNRGLMREEEIRDNQIIEHLRRARRDIETARVLLEIDEEAAFNYAYLAMLRSGRALMFCYGYRTIDGAQHWTVGEFAGAALGDDAQRIVAHFDDMRRTRNQFTYDPGVPVSETEAEEAINYAVEFINYVIPSIIRKRPDITSLMPYERINGGIAEGGEE